MYIKTKSFLFSLFLFLFLNNYFLNEIKCAIYKNHISTTLQLQQILPIPLVNGTITIKILNGICQPNSCIIYLLNRDEYIRRNQGKSFNSILQFILVKEFNFTVNNFQKVLKNSQRVVATSKSTVEMLNNEMSFINTLQQENVLQYENNNINTLQQQEEESTINSLQNSLQINTLQNSLQNSLLTNQKQEEQQQQEESYDFEALILIRNPSLNTATQVSFDIEGETAFPIYAIILITICSFIFFLLIILVTVCFVLKFVRKWQMKKMANGNGNGDLNNNNNNGYNKRESLQSSTTAMSINNV